MEKVRYFPIINKSDSCKIRESDICYITRDNRVLVFGTDDGIRKTYGKMDLIERYLGTDFIRCMSGCIINMSRIKEVKDSIVYFDNGERLKLGRDGYIRLKQRFNVYLRNIAPWDTDDDQKG